LKTDIIQFLCHVRRHYYHLRLKYGKHTSAHILAGRCGFFGNLFMTLNGIRLCETANVLPQPLWGEESLFFEKAYGPNVWEYYFERIVPLDNEELLGSGLQIAFKPDAVSITPLYSGLNARESYNRCIENYVKLRKPVQKSINEVKDQFFANQHVIGVHARFTDAQAGYENRTTAPMAKYYQVIDDHMVNNPVDKIFVATDSHQALVEFKKRYGTYIIALDGLRSKDNTSIHGHYDSGISGSPYLKGLQVLQDSYLLSSVNHLISVYSRVASYALCLQPHLTYTDITKKRQK
jgi:hypothetical protein